MKLQLLIAIVIISLFGQVSLAQENAVATETSPIKNMMKDANVTFEHNTALDFSVLIPQNFRIVPKDRLRALEVGDRYYGEIFEAFGPAIELGLRPYIKVVSIRPMRIISPEKWFQLEILNKGHALREMDVISENEIRVSYVRIDDNGYSENVDTRIFHHQNRLIAVEYILPKQMLDNHTNFQAASIDSFSFNNAYERMAQEKVRPFIIEGLNLQYPESWRFRLNETDAINRQEFEIQAIDQNQYIFATVTGALIANKSLRDRLDKTFYLVNLKEELLAERQAIEDMGFIIEDPIETHRYDTLFKTDFAVVEVYPMRRKMNSVFVIEEQSPITHELWLVAMRTSKDVGKNYILTMILPARDQNYTQWAYGVDGLEYIVESIR